MLTYCQLFSFIWLSQLLAPNHLLKSKLEINMILFCTPGFEYFGKCSPLLHYLFHVYSCKIVNHCFRIDEFMDQVVSSHLKAETPTHYVSHLMVVFILLDLYSTSFAFSLFLVLFCKMGNLCAAASAPTAAPFLILTPPSALPHIPALATALLVFPGPVWAAFRDASFLIPDWPRHGGLYNHSPLAWAKVEWAKFSGLQLTERF